MMRKPQPRPLVLLVVAIAVTAVVVPSALARFTDSQAVTNNAFATGNWGCAIPGGQTVNAIIDSWVNQASTGTNYGADTTLIVRSRSGSRNARTFVKFTLPTLPAGCAVTSATLRVYNQAPVSGRTIAAYQAAATPVWTQNGITWTNQPVTTGAAALSTTVSMAGWQVWTVTTQVQAMYSGTNNGFRLSDQTENGAGIDQRYTSRKGAVAQIPQLIVNWA